MKNYHHHQIWKAKLRDNYRNYKKWEQYAFTFNLHTRLGYNHPRQAWNANPTIQGSTNPDDFKVVPDEVDIIKVVKAHNANNIS